MKVLSAFLAAGALVALFAQAPAPAPSQAVSDAKPKSVGTMSELMVDIIYPTSDDLFYIVRGAPTTDKAWNDYQARMLMLAESANLLMMEPRMRDKGKWMDDAKLLWDVGQAAFKAAKAKDAKALEGLSDQLYNACVTCHEDYRPRYGTRPRK
jgi:hypothetical protein